MGPQRLSMTLGRQRLHIGTGIGIAVSLAEFEVWEVGLGLKSLKPLIFQKELKFFVEMPIKLVLGD
jgi:hypothetical protein